jgi:hypothetical protein
MVGSAALRQVTAIGCGLIGGSLQLYAPGEPRLACLPSIGPT